MIKQVFQTEDGSIFEQSVDAERHEAALNRIVQFDKVVADIYRLHLHAVDWPYSHVSMRNEDVLGMTDLGRYLAHNWDAFVSAANGVQVQSNPPGVAETPRMWKPGPA